MENSLVPEAASITDSANTSPYFSANSHCWGCWTQVTKTSPEESKEYLAYFVQGVLAISPSIFKIIVSRERSIDVPGDGTVLWRFLPEKGSNMQVKTHPKNINSNMVGLRLGRLALGSVHCCKFSKSQCTPAELAVADYSWDRFGYLSTSGEVRERQKELTHTHTHSVHLCSSQGSADAATSQRSLDASTAQGRSWDLTAAGVPGSCKQLLSKMLSLRFSWRNHSSSPPQNSIRENRWVGALGSVIEENMRNAGTGPVWAGLSIWGRWNFALYITLTPSVSDALHLESWTVKKKGVNLPK